VIENLHEVEARYERLTQELSDSDVIADMERFQRLARDHSELEPLVAKFREYRVGERQLAEARALTHDSDPEVREMAEEEVRGLADRLEEIQRGLTLMLLPRDPNDEKDTMVEIRAGTGGEEAALFAADLLRMYTRYAERMGWNAEILSATQSGTHGYREVVLEIKGKGAYSHLKFEGGPHRVQRVPETESSGRIHTSAATVAVMPEVEDVEVDIRQADCDWDVFLSSSAGGQNVQKNSTAVRLTHKPSGIVVQCQDQRSQLQNKEKAMRMLRARLYDRMLAERDRETSAARRSQVASGDRSDKIRTYNFPQGRITDHRIGLTLYRLEGMLDGDISDLIEALRTADETERLAHASADGTNGHNGR
jgi:peptide chain release factor 1